MKSELQKLIYKNTGKKAIIEHPVDMEHGDYSTNVALKTRSEKSFDSAQGKQEARSGNPMELANEIVNKIRSAGMPEYISKIEVVQPGFINFWLSQEYLANQLEGVLKDKDGFGKLTIGKGKTVVIDYSSPNIAKPFGIGHLRSTVIGQAIYNLYNFCGWKTIGDNHLGDWGTQFGKLIYQIQNSKVKIPLQGKQNLTIEKLEKLYVDFHKKVEKHPEIEDEARKYFQMLEAGDKEVRRIWQACVDLSLKEFNRIYDLLGIKIDYAFGESFYEDKMAEVIVDAKRKKLAVESQGALIISFDELNIPPGILLKSDGATMYFTRDLACVLYRQRRWNPDLYIYEVGSDQKLHFQQVFAGAVKLHYGKMNQFVHVAHGLIRFPEGKMSTRAGKTVHLDTVLDEAIKRATKIIKKSSTGRGMTVKQQEQIAKAVGIGAVKYFDLKHQPETDIIYDWEKMFQLEGDSGPYLQYTFARTRSVLNKIKNKILNIKNTDQILKIKNTLNSEELGLLRTIYRFPEVIELAAENYSPNLICNFLFDLAQKYNNFYNIHRILGGGDSEEFRLALTAATGQVLKNGLSLLGIDTPERM
ncbi:arginine--tRNA ligase [Candidatus Shapirobacteria bacterium CG_4_10_14_0_8_um_filter_39_15]|nr:MAG: arginine--tRNA ligase [Candidatus Shapirobacteria bacterium CG_4_10_14_0_8_um_filter_39_15]